MRSKMTPAVRAAVKLERRRLRNQAKIHKKLAVDPTKSVKIIREIYKP